MAEDIWRINLAHPSSQINGSLQSQPFSGAAQAILFVVQIPSWAADNYNKIHVLKVLGGGPGQDYRFGFKGLLTSNGAFNTGASWLGASGLAYGDLSNPANGLLEITTGEAAALTAGQFVAVGIESVAGSPTASFALGQQFVNQTRCPYTGFFNSTWSFQNVAPAVGIVSADGTKVLSPFYMPTQSVVTLSTANEFAMSYTMPAGVGTWELVGIEVNLSTITGAGTLDFVWYPGLNTTDTTGTTLLSLPGGYAARAAAAPYRLWFQTPVPLSAGSSGRISCRNATGSNIQYTVLDYPNTTLLESQVGGDDSYYWTRSTGDWTGTNTRKASLVLLLRPVGGAGGIIELVSGGLVL